MNPENALFQSSITSKDRLELYDSVEAGQRVWYIAYGSNMNPSTFQGMRKIIPIRTEVCSVPSAWTSFEVMGTPYSEPAHCSILVYEKELHDIMGTDAYMRYVWERCCPGVQFANLFPPRMYAVAYLITEEQWIDVQISEGGWGHDDIEIGYYPLEIECLFLSTSERVKAKTLVCRPKSSGFNIQPSQRYLDLCRDGANISNLPNHYIKQYWDTLVAWNAITRRKKIGKFVFTITFTPFFLFQRWMFKRILKSQKIQKDPEAPHFKPPPKWAIKIFVAGVRFIWWSHRAFFKPIFGSGFNNDS